MHRKTIIMFVLLTVFAAADILTITRVQNIRKENGRLAAEWSALSKMSDSLPAQSPVLKEDAVQIETALSELKIDSHIKRFKREKDRVDLRLEGLSQKQLFMLLKTLSQKTKHRILQCEISKHGSGLTLTAEIQLL